MPEKKRALVVDDTPEHRSVTKVMLLMRGFEVEEACNGVEAWAALTSGRHFDLVFSDVSMPNMNGFELLKQVRRRPLLKTLPFILLTSEKTQNDIDNGNRLGCTYYMLKPFSTDELKKAFAAAHLG
jgi:two-component system chemotaxis sensor kinase CheA